MEGFIVNLNRVKEEDLIVSIVSKKSLDTLYRFYGARHGSINIGFKIDYEIEESSKTTIGRLKDVIHIGYPWINNKEKLHLWQQFCKLFYPHLKETEGIESFYFTLLEDASKLWGIQNPLRVAIESYIKLLEYEGRLHVEDICFLCSGTIAENPAVVRAFMQTHPRCSKHPPISKAALHELYTNKSSLFLSDSECLLLWNVLQEGL